MVDDAGSWLETWTYLRKDHLTMFASRSEHADSSHTVGLSLIVAFDELICSVLTEVTSCDPVCDASAALKVTWALIQKL